MNHSTAFTIAVHKNPVCMYRGNTAATLISDEAHNDPKRGFAGGYYLEGFGVGLPVLAASLQPGAWGRDLTSLIDMYDHMSGLMVIGGDPFLGELAMPAIPVRKLDFASLLSRSPAAGELLPCCMVATADRASFGNVFVRDRFPQPPTRAISSRKIA